SNRVKKLHTRCLQTKLSWVLPKLRFPFPRTEYRVDRALSLPPQAREKPARCQQVGASRPPLRARPDPYPNPFVARPRHCALDFENTIITPHPPALLAGLLIIPEHKTRST
ncbi:unnamed protein product, partial [Ectocarpus fasciculatus]